ncbi:MAG: hypothetical protein EON89_04345 [Brevundimonas sp.]|nr:MAG: hypothetical protein EON89_04345 [Brevundimonas sp.]
MKLSAALVLLALASPSAAIGQTPPPGAAPQEAAPTAVEDVVVEGVRRTRETSFAFVRAVSAPPFGSYTMAVWTGPLCLSIDNLPAEQAAALTDRILGRVEYIGVTVGDANCTPNVRVIFTADGAATARDLVAHNRRDLRPTSAATQLGRAGLTRFAESERPVRWWTVNMPVDGETNSRVVALAGDIGDNRGQAVQMGIRNPLKISTGGPPWRLILGIQPVGNGIRDSLLQTIVIVDARLAAGVSYASLGDYIAMVALTQVDPEADVSTAPTILNLFTDSPRVTELSQWDVDYLKALYDAPVRFNHIRFQEEDIARRMVQAAAPAANP